MNNFYLKALVSLLIFCPLQGEAQTFISVEEAVVFLEECVEDDNLDKLFKACVGATCPSKKVTKESVFKKLKGLHKASGLRQVYKDLKFPFLKSKFKLGGHGFHWGHLHIDFERVAKKWQMVGIWQCR